MDIKSASVSQKVVYKIYLDTSYVSDKEVR
jgi:hypothetical protein